MACPQKITYSSLGCSSTPLSRRFSHVNLWARQSLGLIPSLRGLSVEENGSRMHGKGCFLPTKEEQGTSMSPRAGGPVVNPTPVPRSLSSNLEACL